MGPGPSTGGKDYSKEIAAMNRQIMDLTSSLRMMEASTKALDSRVDMLTRSGAASEIMDLRSKTFDNRAKIDSLTRKVDSEKSHTDRALSSMNSDLSEQIRRTHDTLTDEVKKIQQDLDREIESVKSTEYQDFSRLNRLLKEQETRAMKRMATVMEMLDGMGNRISELEDMAVNPNPTATPTDGTTDSVEPTTENIVEGTTTAPETST